LGRHVFAEGFGGRKVYFTEDTDSRLLPREEAGPDRHTRGRSDRSAVRRYCRDALHVLLRRTHCWDSLASECKRPSTLRGPRRLSRSRAKTTKTITDDGHLIGYARVSTGGQDTAMQEAALKAAGCDIVRIEKVSGGSREGRSELASILEFIRPGDVLVVHKLDRLGRNTRDVLNLVHKLDEKGACLRVLEPPIDTCGPMGRMVITVLGMVAEMELGFIRDRQRAGIEAAKAEGLYKGRPVKFDRARILELRRPGMGATEIAKAVGCKRGAVYLALKAAAA
jgi:DNA invertase Pin-like site-specific DNA recombinase